jgi:hypothetical protein
MRNTLPGMFACLSGLASRWVVVCRIGEGSRKKSSGCSLLNPDGLSGQCQPLFGKVNSLLQILTLSQLRRPPCSHKKSRYSQCAMLGPTARSICARWCPLVGFGYRPGRAFGWSLLVIALGWLFFQLGDDWKLFTPTGDKAYVVQKDGTRKFINGRPQISEDYPKFNAFMYSVETFVPLLKLGIGEHWAPNANFGATLSRGMLVKIGFPRNYGSLLRCYMWVHIISGWVLGTLWIGGLTKLLKT